MARQWMAKGLSDLTKCTICIDVFSDPRILPCVHTFCLKCLLNCMTDRQPGDDMPCPLCRTLFTIPDDGLSGLQKNFFMEEAISLRKISAEEEATHMLCDECSCRDAAGPSEAKSSTKRCFECQQNDRDHCPHYSQYRRSAQSDEERHGQDH